jgi:Calcium-activated chloride channel
LQFSFKLALLIFFCMFSDRISEYFGVKIAMYFAWLGHYTTALIVPAVVGFIFWVSLIYSVASLWHLAPRGLNQSRGLRLIPRALPPHFRQFVARARSLTEVA